MAEPWTDRIPQAAVKEWEAHNAVYLKQMGALPILTIRFVNSTTWFVTGTSPFYEAAR